MKKQDRTIDAFKDKARRQAKPDQQAFSTFSSRRSSSDHEEPAVGTHLQPADGLNTYSRRCIRCCAAVVLTLVVFLLHASQSPAEWDSSFGNAAVGAGGYLRQIADMHDWRQTAADVAQLGQGLQDSLTYCAKQLILPEVKVPQHVPRPAWFPPTGSRLPQIAVLDLNCSNPAHADACAEAAASNSYEGASTVLSAAEVAELLLVRSPAASAAAPDASWLSGLELDCTVQPAACADVSASMNAYEGHASHASDASAVAEAAAYLTGPSTASSAHAAWDAVIGSSQQQHLGAMEHAREQLRALTNRYEGVQASSWQHRRQAEEAGAQYLDVSTLDLDCSPAGVSTDPHAYMECRRSRAVNKYEAHMPHGAEELQLLPEEETAADNPIESVLAAAANGADTSVELRRTYYKTACSSITGQEQYKNPRNQQQHARRKFYKNAANAPATLDALMPQLPKDVKGAKTESTIGSLLRSVLGSTRLWTTLLVLLVTCWFMEDLAAFGSEWVLAASAAVAGWCDKALRRRTAVRRTRSMMLVPCASQELPAPQLMQVELSARSPLPALSALANTCSPAPAQPTARQSLDIHDTTVVGALPGAGVTCLALDPAAPSPDALSADGAGAGAGDGLLDVAGAGARVQEAGQAQAAGHMQPWEEVMQMPDDIQAGNDSPRGGHRRSMTPLLARSRAGTPGPMSKLD